MKSSRVRALGHAPLPGTAATAPGTPPLRWYFPSWNGDLRLEPHASDPARTVLTAIKPTAHEQKVVNAIGAVAVTRNWLPAWSVFEAVGADEWTFELAAPVADVGPLVRSLLRPGADVLTTIRYADGTTAALTPNADRDAADPAAAPASSAPAVSPVPRAETPVAAVTVARPTPCCPRCVEGAVSPANEVLQTFLSPEEHDRWAHNRTLIVTGGLTGFRYLLAHRHSKTAARIGRVCFELDHREVVHFHDHTVPPEEEILAAKHILEHRENWLRNEATMNAPRDPSLPRFKNPFGDYLDGNFDARLMETLGNFAMGFLRGPARASLA